MNRTQAIRSIIQFNVIHILLNADCYLIFFKIHILFENIYGPPVRKLQYIYDLDAEIRGSFC